MKNFLLTSLICISLIGSVSAQAPDWSWSKSIGSGANDAGNAITTDDNGNVYTLGYFNDTVDFDPGPGAFILIANPATSGSLFLTKMDSSGNFLWARHWNKGLTTENGFSVNTDQNENVFITGYYTVIFDADPGPATVTMPVINYQSYYVIKLNSLGLFEWIRNFGGCLNSARCVTALDNDGNIYTAGFFSHTYDFNPGPIADSLTAASGSRDLFILKLDSVGNFLWVKQISGTLNNWVYDIALDGDANIFLTGNFSGTVDFDPGPGIASQTASTTFNNEDAYVMKLDSAGNFAWAKKWGGSGYDKALGITVDVDSKVYVTGHCSGASSGIDYDPGPGNLIGYLDCFISKFDSSGNILFAKTVGNSSDATWGRSIAVDPSGGIYVSGDYMNSADFDPGTGIYNLIPDSSGAAIFIMKLDNTGQFSWAESKGGRQHTGTQQNRGAGLFADAAGNVYFTGRFEDPWIEFGNDSIFSHTPGTLTFTDACIAKIIGTTTGLNDDALNSQQLTVYPNPSNGIIFLPGDGALQQLSVYNLEGKLVYDEKSNIVGVKMIDLSLLENATYVYKVMKQDGSFVTGKICIQK